MSTWYLTGYWCWLSQEKELEELQNLAQEIRKEQINLELLYDVKSSRDHLLSSVESKTKEDDSSVCLSESQEEPRRTSSIDFLQIISPIVIKASEQNSVPLSNLQVRSNASRNDTRTMARTTKHCSSATINKVLFLCIYTCVSIDCIRQFAN